MLAISAFLVFAEVHNESYKISHGIDDNQETCVYGEDFITCEKSSMPRWIYRMGIVFGLVTVMIIIYKKKITKKN
ncbi:MAG: hypothetical protein J4F36_04415 [Nitrosopumilaceae archaeon]|nr:hypothetical protein [Nitrosopumilaceae archaeon]